MKSASVKRFAPCVAALLAGILALPLPGQNSKQAAKFNEYQVKAAYLKNFVQFVDWPADSAGAPNEPYPICVLGADPFGAALDGALSGESVNHHPLIPRRLANAKQATSCRVLYISSDEAEVRRGLSAVENASILTVSDYPEFLDRGGMIQFVIDNNHVRFEINLIAARKVGLTLSSELLKIARSVRMNQ
jgi:hypothetical protein